MSTSEFKVPAPKVPKYDHLFTYVDPSSGGNQQLCHGVITLARDATEGTISIIKESQAPGNTPIDKVLDQHATELSKDWIYRGAKHYCCVDSSGGRFEALHLVTRFAANYNSFTTFEHTQEDTKTATEGLESAILVGKFVGKPIAKAQFYQVAMAHRIFILLVSHRPFIWPRVSSAKKPEVQPPLPGAAPPPELMRQGVGYQLQSTAIEVEAAASTPSLLWSDVPMWK